MIDNMVATVEQHSEYTLGQINTELRVALPNKPQITETTVASALKYQLIVLKKLETVQQDRNREDLLHARRKYGEWLLNVVDGMNPRELIFVDESGFNSWICRTRGRAARGERAVRIVGGSRDHNFTLIFAASNMLGMIHHEFFEGGTNVARFNAWLQAASEAVGNGNATFIFDNASCHRRFSEAGLPLNHDCKLLPAFIAHF